MSRNRWLLVALTAATTSCATASSPRPAPSTVVIPPPIADAKSSLALYEMVRLDGGTFTMLGSPYPYEPPHQETVATFEIGRTEVTTAAYRNCVKAGPCTTPVGIQQGADNAMTPLCVEQIKSECNFERNDRENHRLIV